MPISAEYITLSKWDVTNDSPESGVAYLKVVQSIILRESILVKFNLIAENLDLQYWKYTILRMKSAAKKQMINSESLVAKRKVIKGLQMQLTVVLAHFRGSSISVIETINHWRNTIKASNSIQTKETVSVFWEGENYLLKMNTDFSVMCDNYYTMRLWLGFHPSSLVLPPLDPIFISSSNAAFLQRRNSQCIPNTMNGGMNNSSRKLTIPNSVSSPTSRRQSIVSQSSFLSKDGNRSNSVNRRSFFGFNSEILTNMQEAAQTNVKSNEFDAKSVWENDHYIHYLLWNKIKTDKQWEKDRQKRLIGYDGVSNVEPIINKQLPLFSTFLSPTFSSEHSRQLFALGTKDNVIFPETITLPHITTILELQSHMNQKFSTSAILPTTNENNHENCLDIYERINAETGVNMGNMNDSHESEIDDVRVNGSKKKSKSYKELSFFYSNSEVAELLPSVLDGTSEIYSDHPLSSRIDTPRKISNFLGDMLHGELTRSRTNSDGGIVYKL